MNNYISFTPYYCSEEDHHVRRAWIEDVITWLMATAGEYEKDWLWCRGDIIANGVYIQDPQVAVLFRLRFNV
jgi:hypothetical protein